MAKSDANVSIGADGSAFTSTLKKMQRDTDTMANSVTARLARLGQAFQALTGLGGLVKGLGVGLMDAAKAVIAPAAQAETLALSFEVMLGSEAETLDFMERLNKYAAETPFALDEISEAAKLMLANTSMGADEVMVTLERIGNLSAMTGKSMRDIAQVYAKAMNVGVTNEVAESLETMGVPIRKTIAELQGISFEEVFKKISNRELGAVHLNAALETLTTTGGKFDGATKRLSQTFEGLASTLDDNVNAALRTFGEQLLPEVKPIMEKLIELVDAAMPSVERLGMMFGDWLGDKVQDKVVPALDELILQLPVLGIQFEYMLGKAQEFADTMFAVPKALGSAWESYDHYVKRVNSYLVYSNMDWADAGRHATRIQKANSPERQRQKQLRELEKLNKERMEEYEERRKERKKEAAARDAARAAEKAANAEAKRANDERLRGQMAAAEEKKKADEEEKARMEENQRRWENYAARRRDYERAVEKKAFDKKSLREQESELRTEAAWQGVLGKVSPESIRARLDELAAAGAKTNEREIAALERLLQAWDELTERKVKYGKVRKEDMAELRVRAMEALGNTRGAEKLRAQLELAKRVAELQEEGYSKGAAKKQAAMEAKVAEAAGLREKMQAARTEVIQGHLASVGGGGVSYRIGGSQLAEAKKHTKLMGEIKNWLKKQGNAKVAVLA